MMRVTKILVLVAAMSACLVGKTYAQSTSTLSITTPSANQVYRAGTTIDVAITASNPQALSEVGLFSTLPSGVIAIQAVGGSMSVSVPLAADTATGEYTLSAIGALAAGGRIESLPVTIRVAPSSAATRLVAPVRKRFEHPGVRLPLEIRADVGGRLVVLDASLLSFQSSDLSVAVVSRDGAVTAEGPGTATIAVRYAQPGGDLTTAIQVVVGGATRGDLNGDGRVTETDWLRISEWVGHFSTGQNDARDLNGDGRIDAADLAALESLCTETCTPPRDTVLPVVSCASPDGLWHAVNVTMACTSQDYEDGLARSADLSFNLVTTVGVGVETADAGTDSRQVCDVAGNCAAAGPVRGNRIDRLAPSLTLPAPQAVLQTQPSGAVVNYPAPIATDGGSGVAATDCAPASGSVFALGTTTVTCTTADAVGNSRTGSFTVTVSPGTTNTDGRLFGKGYVSDIAKRHHHFLLRAKELDGREFAKFEYWANPAAGCQDDQEDGRVGRDDAEYGRGRRGASIFEAVLVESIEFSDDPAFKPGAKKTPLVDTVTIKGSGKWNGRTGYRFEAVASDRGEPGRNRDTVSIVIRDANNAVVASVNGALAGGNIQSLRLRK